MSTLIKKQSSETVLPAPMTKKIKKVGGDSLAYLGITGFVTGSISGMVGLIPGLLTADVSLTINGFITAGAIGATLVPSLAQRINSWYAVNENLEKLLPRMVYQAPNFFQVSRSLKEKRKVFEVEGKAGDGRKEVHVITNIKGVWIEEIVRKYPASVWDESMTAVVELHSLPAKSRQKAISL